MREYDLVVVGGGSGNMVFGPGLEHWHAAVVEADRFGGTCLHRGCVPSKMLVAAADVATTVQDASRLDVAATFDGVDWLAMRERIFGRLDPTHERAIRYRERGGVDVYTSTARFVAPRVLEIDGERITARHIVVAVGSRPELPPIPGLDAVPFQTSDTIMRVDALPPSLAIIGGGAIAAELGHVFGAFGSDVTILSNEERLLTNEDVEVSTRFTELLGHRLHVRTGVTVTGVEPSPGGGATVVWTDADDAVQRLTVATLLVAIGRVPNTDRLDAAAGGLELDDDGRLVLDAHCRSNVDGVWGLGDVANQVELKHIANAQARVVRHNLLHPDDLVTLGTSLTPHAVFSSPQVASVGVTEAEARASDRPVVVASRSYGSTAFGWALEDTTGFVKVIADAQDRTILGAHVIGPDAALLLQPLLQAMMLGQTADQVAHDVLYVHPTLTEVVEQALLQL